MGRKKQVIMLGNKQVPQEKVSMVKKMVSKLNQRLARLEKSGLAMDSKEYRTIMHYAVDKNDNKYVVDVQKGTIRLTTDLTRFTTAKQWNDYVSTLEKIDAAKTSGVRGTKEAIKKAQEKLKEKLRIRPGSLKYKDIDYDKYRKIWEIYRNNVTDSRKQKQESDTIFNILAQEKGFYDLSEDQIAEALKYANNYRGSALEDKIYEEYEDLF